jgi:RHS repeat-associated protein
MTSSANTTAGTTRTYQYDPSGRLVAARGGGLTDEFFLYRDGTEPIAWARGLVRQYYVYRSQPHVPDLIYEDSDSDADVDNVYRVLADERGSVRLVMRLDASPTEVQRIEYDVFGNPTFVVRGETVQPFGYAGAIWLGHARFWHMGARDYDPAVGRWTSKDPIRFAGGTNLYVYCEGDPVNAVDISGLEGEEDSIGGWLWNNGVLAAWESPSTTVGLLVAVVGGTAPWDLDERNDNPYHYAAYDNWIVRATQGNQNGLTLGRITCYSAPSASEVAPGLRAHEGAHIPQSEVLGPFYIPAHLVGQGYSWGTTGSYRTGNPLEVGPYSNPPRPWP